MWENVGHMYADSSETWDKSKHGNSANAVKAPIVIKYTLC